MSDLILAVATNCNGVSVTIVASKADRRARGACFVGTRSEIEAAQGSRGYVPSALDGGLRACLDECSGGKPVGHVAKRPFPPSSETRSLAPNEFRNAAVGVRGHALLLRGHAAGGGSL